MEEQNVNGDSRLLHGDLTREVIGAAMEVHAILGPGLLESAYESCLAHELALRGIGVQRQVELPVQYKDARVDCGFRVDILAASEIVIELKAVERVLPIHIAQLMTYMKLAQKRVGLLINFNVESLRDGITRRII